jgi:hypothetical protein
MAAITTGAFEGFFTSTQKNGFVFGLVEYDRFQTLFRHGVRAVTKWLRFALPAGTPVIAFTRLDIHFARGFLKDMGFHRQLLFE